MQDINPVAAQKHLLLLDMCNFIAEFWDKGSHRSKCTVCSQSFAWSSRLKNHENPQWQEIFLNMQYRYMCTRKKCTFLTYYHLHKILDEYRDFKYFYADIEPYISVAEF
jgi:hypothetical protein